MTKQEFIEAAAAANYKGFSITFQDDKYYITSDTGLTFGDGFGGMSFPEVDAPAGLIAVYERRMDAVVNAINELI